MQPFKEIDKELWTQLTTQEEYVVQNTSNNTVLMCRTDAVAPTETDSFFEIAPGQGMSSINFPIIGIIWGKAILAGTHKIAISE